MNNLASLILEGSNYSSRSVDMGNYDYRDSMVAESEFLDSAFATLFTDIMEAEKSYMVADIVASATIIREQSMGNSVDIVAVTEGVNGGVIAKIKGAFQKLWAKIKAFYEKVKNWFKAMFYDAGKFVKEFGPTLKKKAGQVKGFEYEGFKYTYDTGSKAVEDVIKNVQAELGKTYNALDIVANGKGASIDEIKAALGNNLNHTKEEVDKMPSTSDVIDEYMTKTLKYDDISDMKSNLTEKFHDGDTVAGKIRDFEANSVDSMVDWITKYDKLNSDLNRELKGYETNINKVISKLDKIKDTKEEKDDAGNVTTAAGNEAQNASRISSITSSLLNVMKAACETRIDVAKEMTSKYHGILKRFLSFKGTKESYVPWDPESYATLESSLIFEGKDEDDDDDDTSKDTDDVATESMISSILEQASMFSF